MPVITVIPKGWQIYMKIADLVVVAFRNILKRFHFFCEGEKNKHFDLILHIVYNFPKDDGIVAMKIYGTVVRMLDGFTLSVGSTHG